VMLVEVGDAACGGCELCASASGARRGAVAVRSAEGDARRGNPVVATDF